MLHNLVELTDAAVTIITGINRKSLLPFIAARRLIPSRIGII